MFRTQSGGTLILSGLPVQEQRHLYGQVALQVSALGQAPEARNGVTLQGARLLVVSLRSPEDLARDWGEVFGIIARALWHRDCVVVHCMAGRHRAALLVCVTLALLRGTSLAATETWMLTRRQIELNEVRSRDPQLWDWANRAVRGTRMPLQYPAPIGFTATESSHLHRSCRMGPPYAAMLRARLVHQIVFATPTPPVTGMRRLHGSDLSAMNAFVGPLLAFGL